MTNWLLITATAVLVGLAAMAVVWYRRSSTQPAIVTELNDRLADALGPETGSHLEQPPTVREIRAIEQDESSEIVPVVRVDLDTTDAPGMAIIFDYVASVLTVVHPVFDARDDRVSQYDVQFTFGPDGLIVAGECRRVSVPPELADRLLGDDSYRTRDLWQAVKRGDRRGEAGTTLWDAC